MRFKLEEGILSADVLVFADFRAIGKHTTAWWCVINCVSFLRKRCIRIHLVRQKGSEIEEFSKVVLFLHGLQLILECLPYGSL